MISQENFEAMKELIYYHCKGRRTLKIGGLMTLRNLVSQGLGGSPPNWRITEACHLLANSGYIEIKDTDKSFIFSSGKHFATPKLLREMQIKEHSENKVRSQTSLY